jgi:hypothetical protein
MNPLSILSKGKAAWSFASGTPIDPGPGIVEIEQYLAARNLPSDATNRAQAFQNFYNAHHMSPSIHPNVTTADASRMAESDSVMSVLGNQPGNTTVWKELTAGLERVKQAPGVLGKAWESVAPAGVWGTDELGRSVQRSTSGPIQSAINQFRSTVDTWNRTTYILDRLDKTKSLKDAFAASDKFLLNADP